MTNKQFKWWSISCVIVCIIFVFQMFTAPLTRFSICLPYILVIFLYGVLWLSQYHYQKCVKDEIDYLKEAKESFNNYRSAFLNLTEGKFYMQSILTIAPYNKYRVVGITKFDNKIFVIDDVETFKEAVDLAKEKADGRITTRVFDQKGGCLFDGKFSISKNI